MKKIIKAVAVTVPLAFSGAAFAQGGVDDPGPAGTGTQQPGETGENFGGQPGTQEGMDQEGSKTDTGKDDENKKKKYDGTGSEYQPDSPQPDMPR